MASNVEARIAELGLELPPPLPAPRSRMRRTAQAGNLVYLSGNGPFRGTELVWKGKVGRDVTLEEAQEAAALTALNMIRVLRDEGYDLDRIRWVKALGMVNSDPSFIDQAAVVNGFSQIDKPESMFYYDLPRFWPFWSVVEALDVPFYLHPRNPLPSAAQIYEGHPWLLGPTWAFGQETAVHALRLMASGLFDKHPRLKIILGHLGEGLPYSIWRVDNRNAWVKTPPRYPAKKKLGDY